MKPTAPDLYASLRRVLDQAYEQASAGKGNERHANPDERFEDQPIIQIGLNLGSNHFEIGQAVKKAIESARLPPDRAVAELLGAINYLAAAVLVRSALVCEPAPDPRLRERERAR